MAKPPPRLFVESPLVTGETVALEKGQTHYLKNVLRLEVGATVALFNGRDGEWHGAFGISGNAGSVVAETLQRTQSEAAGPGLMFAPIKKGPMEIMVQKATELGVARLNPVITDFTDVVRFNRARLRATAVEAAEQCDRLSVPEIEDPLSLSERLENWPANTRLLLAAEAGTAMPIFEALAEIKAAGTGSDWVLAVGPVGGFSPAEHEMLRELPYAVPVGLGPRLLKAETAAIAALSCWQSILGDWDNRPIDRNAG
ncbi:MAG TPA: 16S rRNA (uracil(1498)-N(3))-methyltransferase [Rhodospirillaceae bacterium]|nr:16S rRNA (uracil(1498)-N(3))-methyltransferase [Rhodospirillaceae bacterium]HAA93302.1 16S rRNA (uracil(1498)-N(3))-methyltransferase [Rhodospirillaceae bacterium]HAT36799.1 16S rRNA (uracil(1498)-N(3))-methyltransferase [Rhodospirillaceae bacterium]|tara:strand:- start:71 stop:838 length:768 start_codon:yes stop_codon:yes gene_type:complete